MGRGGAQCHDGLHHTGIIARSIDAAIAPPRLHFSDTVSERDRVTPVDVDLVLDVGNSRTCGILIENFPGKPQVELTRAFPLEIRDLSKPELSYSGLFESRVPAITTMPFHSMYCPMALMSWAFTLPTSPILSPKAPHSITKHWHAAPAFICPTASSQCYQNISRLAFALCAPMKTGWL